MSSLKTEQIAASNKRSNHLNNLMDKTLLKTVTKKVKAKTPKRYTKAFFANCILKSNSVETV